MKIRFYIDPKTDDPHIHRHKVTEQEVEMSYRIPVKTASGTKEHKSISVRPGFGRYQRAIYVPELYSIFVITAYDLSGKALIAYPKAYAKKEKMKLNKFPPEWNEERAQRVSVYYESQTDEEAVAEDEAAYEDAGQAIMKSPHELVPRVRDLIAQHQKSMTHVLR